MIQPGRVRDLDPVARPVPRWALALPLLVVVAATATAAALITSDRSPRTASVSGGLARVGGAAPVFSSWDLDGRRVSLTDFKGHPVLITFWATWCTACEAELPAVQRIRDQYQGNGLDVLAVNYRESNTGRMSAYLAGLHVDLEALIDPDGAIATAYGVNIGLPITVLLDSRETVTQIIVGATSGAALQAAVTQALASP